MAAPELPQGCGRHESACAYVSCRPGMGELVGWVCVRWDSEGIFPPAGYFLSLAHYLGEQPFDDLKSPRDHMVTALVTFGEGYHNFHHEFPSDYRNAIEWHQYDPTKWTIWMWKQLGLAYNLKQFRANEIKKGRVQQLEKMVHQKRAEVNWGIPLDQLPVMEWNDYAAQKTGRELVAIAGVVHDVTDFVEEHAGGRAMIDAGVGKDATAMFNGGVYRHANAAHNILSTMRVGVIRGGVRLRFGRRKITVRKSGFRKTGTKSPGHPKGLR